MKAIKILWLLILASLFSINIVFAQTVDEVIDKYIVAMGGMDKLKTINTVKVTGKTSGGPMNIAFTRTYKRPDKIRMEMQMQGMSLIMAYDGTTAWSINPFRGVKDAEKMNQEQTKMMKKDADFEGILVNYKDKGYTAELMDKEDFEGSEVFKIKLTDKDSDVTNFFIDASTFLLLKESSKTKIKEKEITSETFYGDYKTVEGILIAHSIEVKTVGGGRDQSINIEKVEFNLDTDDNIFKMPESKQ